MKRGTSLLIVLLLGCTFFLWKCSADLNNPIDPNSDAFKNSRRIVAKIISVSIESMDQSEKENMWSIEEDYISKDVPHIIEIEEKVMNRKWNMRIDGQIYKKVELLDGDSTLVQVLRREKTYFWDVSKYRKPFDIDSSSTSFSYERTPYAKDFSVSITDLSEEILYKVILREIQDTKHVHLDSILIEIEKIETR